MTLVDHWLCLHCVVATALTRPTPALLPALVHLIVPHYTRLHWPHARAARGGGRGLGLPRVLVYAKLCKRRPKVVETVTARAA
eukprot:COSAG04_NODE_14922_length_550_cov_0.390244_1_plen_82_part_10